MNRIPAVTIVISAVDLNTPAVRFRERARLAQAKAEQLRQQALMAEMESALWDKAADEIDELMERVVIPQLRVDPSKQRATRPEVSEKPNA